MRNAIAEAALAPSAPSPGTPGAGRGEGRRSDGRPWASTKTLTPTRSRVTGRRGRAACLLLLAAATGCPEPSAERVTPGPLESARNALRAEQFDAAVADADDSLRGQPHGPEAAEANYIKGYAFQNKSFQDAPADRREDLVAARSAYEAALAERPPSILQGYVRTGLSNVALYEDDFPTAIEQAALAMPLVERPQTKAGLLYNTGLAQQRLGRFAEADQTFRQVIQRSPGTPPAAAAEQHLGRHDFFVELPPYATSAAADRAAVSLRSTGSVLSRRSDAAGRTVLDLGPFSTYTAARQQRDALSGSFPTALVVP